MGPASVVVPASTFLGVSMTADRSKLVVKRALQRACGLHGYLVAHSLFVSATLRFRRENGDVRAFIEELRPDFTVLDVGANVGAMTVAFARHCPKGKVFAFEPIPENARAAERIIKLHGLRNTRLYKFAIGDQVGTLEMVMPAKHGARLDGLSHVVHPGSAEDGEHYVVPSIRLDDLAPMFGRVDAMKIDVEDHEQYVIRGARQIIARDHPLIYAEIWSEDNMRGCLDVLAPLGYHVEVLEAGRRVPYGFERGLEPLNFFFVP
jgi:FkbM family methyltransferase